MLNATRIFIFEGKQLCRPSELGGVLARQGISTSCWRGDETAFSSCSLHSPSLGITSSSSACDAVGGGDSVMLHVMWLCWLFYGLGQPFLTSH